MASVTGRSSHDVNTLQNPTWMSPSEWSVTGMTGSHSSTRGGATTVACDRSTCRVGAAVPVGERVVDLGCGTGRHATAPLAESVPGCGRRHLTGERLTREQAIPAARFVVGAMTHLAFRPGVFGGVTAFFSLIHVPRDQQLDVLPPTRSWLKPGGVLVVTMGVSGSENSIGSFLGTPMFWSSWSLPRTFGSSNKPATEWSQRLTSELENGTPVTHLWVVAHAA